MRRAGRPREDVDTVVRLARLHMAVRVDRGGRLERDYQIAENVYQSRGGIKGSDVSSRYYLADAAFLVGLQDLSIETLQTLHSALSHPHWPLFLGRKAMVPSHPVFLLDGLRTGQDLRSALATYPFLGHSPVPNALRIVIEDDNGEQVRPDVPISFAERRFSSRRVTNQLLTLTLPDTV